MTLNNIQIKIIKNLYHSQRESISRIAKQTSLTRTQVEYNLKILEKEGIIKKHLAMFNYGALGYNIYITLFVKLERYSSFGAFTRMLDNSRYCISWGQAFGKYDVFSNLIFKSDLQVQEFLSDIMNEKNAIVDDYLLIRPYVAEFYPLKLWGIGKGLSFPLAFPNGEKLRLDDKDIQIIKMIEEDARIKVIDIAKKLNISAELALYKLKNLYNNKVILGTRIHLDLKKIGYNYSGFFIHIKNFSDSVRKKIMAFSHEHRLINALVLSLTKPNCFLQVFHKTEDELKETIKELKEILKNELFDLEVILINDEEKVNTLPFLKIIVKEHIRLKRESLLFY